MIDPSDAALEALLRESFEGPVPADGFSERVMESLPPRRPRFRSWPMVAGVVAGVVACWLSLRSVPAMVGGWQDWGAPERSASAMTLLLAIGGISLLACLWALTEADHRGASIHLAE